MLILALDTSTPRSSVALLDSEQVVASATLGREQRHGEFIAPAIDFCLTHVGAQASDVSGVAVGVGPGLYTGLRIGIATAKVFAAARNLPVVGLSGLDVLAFNVRSSRRLICAVIDARRREVFWGMYRCSPGGVMREGELRVGSPDKLAGEILASGEEVLLVGEGALRHRDQLPDTMTEFATEEHAYPYASAVGLLARPRFIREETQRPDELEPIYLRRVDAKIGWEQRGRLRGGEAGQAHHGDDAVAGGLA